MAWVRIPQSSQSFLLPRANALRLGRVANLPLCDVCVRYVLCLAVLRVRRGARASRMLPHAMTALLLLRLFPVHPLEPNACPLAAHTFFFFCNRRTVIPASQTHRDHGR
jgi:hypothetical protein